MNANSGSEARGGNAVRVRADQKRRPGADRRGASHELDGSSREVDGFSPWPLGKARASGYFLLVALCLGAVPEGWQAQPRLAASLRVPSGPLYVGETIRVEVVLSGGTREARMIHPERPDLLAVGPIEPTHRVVSQNSTETIWGLSVLLNHPGKIRVGPLTIVDGERKVRTPAREIVALVPPIAGRPQGFLGGVGRVEVQARADRSTILLGESVVVEIQLSGPGAPGCSRPSLPDLEKVRVRERPPERSDDGRSIVYRWELRPSEIGALVLPPVRIAWFDPRTRRYQTTVTDSIRVEVALPQPELARELPPKASNVVAWRGRRTGRIGGFLVVTGTVTWALIVVFRRQRGSLPRMVAKAIRTMNTLEQDEAFAQAFMDCLTRVLRRMDAQAPSVLTPGEVRDRLLDGGAGEEFADRGFMIVAECDRVLYSGTRGTIDALDRQRWMDDLRAIAQKIDRNRRANRRSGGV